MLRSCGARIESAAASVEHIRRSPTALATFGASMYGPTDTPTVSLLALGRQTDDGCEEACRNIYGIGVILLAITSRSCGAGARSHASMKISSSGISIVSLAQAWASRNRRE
jgi:hypothetical protein